MNKLILLCLLFFFPLYSADNSEYLEKVRLDPEHGTLNYDGKIKILFDLPKNDLVEKAYLSVFVGVKEIVVESTVVDGKDLAYLNNSLTLKGSELYEIIDSEKNPGFVREDVIFAEPADLDIVSDEDTSDNDILEEATDEETPDKDSDIETGDYDSDYEKSDKAWADKAYKIKLTLELDTSSTGSDNETDDSDTETTTTTTVPASVSEDLEVVFDNIPPEAPGKITFEGGDQRIVFSVTPPLIDPKVKDKYEKIGKYHVKLTGKFLNGDSEIDSELEYTTEVSSASYDEVWEFSVSGKDGLELINNDKNLDEYKYKVTIYAEDIAGNSNPEKITTIDDAIAVTTFGYWNNYKNNGGKDDGKFCFVATAGFGSYFHPNVIILRDFRDKILSKSGLGRSFIKAYYNFGQIPAKIISEYSFLKPVSRTLLMPLVVFAWLLTSVFGNIIMVLWLVMVLTLFFRRRISRNVIMPVILFGIIAYSGNLYGVDGEFGFNSSFYYPADIDDGMTDKETGESAKPFKTIGGSDLRYLPSLTFGFAMPVLKDYIRWSLIGGIGYTRFKGTAIKADGTKSSDKTEMHFIPLMAEMKLRPVYWFPVWPYATIGIDYYTWWIREKGKTAEDGGTFGFHGCFGLMVSLNWLDDSSSMKFEESTGITNTALFAHYRLEKINDFNKKKSFDLTGSRFEFGIVFEF